jgi:anti-sigma regulatory factor (Ser/Thr protein kinase)
LKELLGENKKIAIRRNQVLASMEKVKSIARKALPEGATDNQVVAEIEKNPQKYPSWKTLNEQLEALDCPMRAQMQIDIAIDELFGNIAHYAYSPGIGQATVQVDVVEEPLSVVITFIDNGVPYDPLAKADPDTTLSVEERDIGGLGIYMVKKSMDEIAYEYKDGQNILKIKKNI